MKLFKNIYKGKKVLVTGHTGFKGSWLVLWLDSLSAEISGYALKPETPISHYSLLNVNNINSIYADIRDRNKLFDFIERVKPDIIFHLAAQSLVLKSYIEPYETMNVNIVGTLNILEACREFKFIKALINVTSDKCYKNTNKGLYDEESELGGDDPYSASKSCQEIISLSYLKSFFLKNFCMATVRAGNVIGGGDWAEDRLVPDIFRKIDIKTKVRNPEYERPWQFVLEPLSGYLLLGQKLLEGKNFFSGPWNFGPNSKEKVINIVNKIKSNWDKVEFFIEEKSEKYSETKSIYIDSTKAKEKLEWFPVWDIDKAVEKTTLWYKKFHEKKEILSLSHINQYIESAKNKKSIWITD